MQARSRWRVSVALGISCTLGMMMGCTSGSLLPPGCSTGGSSYSGQSGYSGYSGYGSCQNNPNGPTGPTPVIADVSPTTVAAGGPAFTLTVLGDYFDTSATVQWQGANISTTYVSPTELQAQISASYIAASGTIPVDVSLSNGNQSNTINFVVSALPSASSGATMTTINVPANDMVWDATSQQIYLSIPNSSTTNGNTITALDPTTGQLGVSQYAGSNPDKLALSSDGSYLYAGIDGSASVQRFNLPGLGQTSPFPLDPPRLAPTPRWMWRPRPDCRIPSRWFWGIQAVSRETRAGYRYLTMQPRGLQSFPPLDGEAGRPALIPSNGVPTLRRFTAVVARMATTNSQYYR